MNTKEDGQQYERLLDDAPDKEKDAKGQSKGE